MKIGIITVHYNCNYGAVLQAYALQEKLCELGYDAEIINYINPYGKNDLKLFKNSAVDCARALMFLRKRIWRIKNFRGFMSDRYKLSGAPVYDYNELSEDKFGYDIYMTGSDQTFNLMLKGDINVRKTYFLPFVKHQPKMSYASSMGEKTHMFSEEHKAWMKKAFSSYTNLSVREKSNADFIENKLKLDRPQVVVDPTLLLDKNKWDKISKPVKYEKGSYILFYSVLSDKWVIEKVKQYADKLHLKVVAPHLKNRFEMGTSFIRAEECGPEEFISLIKNAAFVCTTSFHGTVFSILYNKPFVSFILGEGNRITNLLESLKIEDRAVRKDDDENIAEKLKLDYSTANDLLQEIRETSTKFLTDSIGE